MLKALLLMCCIPGAHLLDDDSDDGITPTAHSQISYKEAGIEKSYSSSDCQSIMFWRHTQKKEVTKPWRKAGLRILLPKERLSERSPETMIVTSHIEDSDMLYENVVSWIKRGKSAKSIAKKLKQAREATQIGVLTKLIAPESLVDVSVTCEIIKKFVFRGLLNQEVFCFLKTNEQVAHIINLQEELVLECKKRLQEKKRKYFGIKKKQ